MSVHKQIRHTYFVVCGLRARNVLSRHVIQAAPKDQGFCYPCQSMIHAVTPTAHLKPTCTLKYLWDKIHGILLSITPKTYQLIHAFVQ